MSDLIRREDAINTALEFFVEFLDGAFHEDDQKILMKRMNELPSAEPERKWIPVTEALPDEEKDVLVSVHFDGYKDKYTNYLPSDYVEIASHIDGVWSSIYDDFKVMRRHHHIVAWMPTPEPYRGDE